MTLAFKVFGVALPKGNMKPRIIRTKAGMQIPIVTESNRNVKSWQQLIREGASHALAALPADERTLIPLGVRLTVAFYLPRPQKFAAKKYQGAFVPHCTAPDLDKLTRAVGDALTEVAYHDDKQITELVVGKYYAVIDGPSFVDIRVEPARRQPAASAVPLDLPLFEPAAVNG
jgi:Holliday junction resolvase RusA-like endonuclease